MSSTQEAKKEEKALLTAAAGGSTAVVAQLLLLVLTVLPLAISVPANVNIIATASLCVFVGCWRSVKETAPSESMTKKVSMHPDVTCQTVRLPSHARGTQLARLQCLTELMSVLSCRTR